MNSAAPWAAPLETLKSVLGLKTWPVGSPLGMPTTRDAGSSGLPAIAPLYRVVLSVPLSETQIGVVGPAAMPHGFTRLGSVLRATPGISDSRFVCRYSLRPRW